MLSWSIFSSYYYYLKVLDINVKKNVAIYKQVT